MQRDPFGIFIPHRERLSVALFTKEDRLIESTKEDPIWFYKPEWISENELEYELPSGEKKIYNIETKEYKPISKN